MNFGGMGAQGALRRKPTQTCKRCGLWHPEEDQQCPHCIHCKTDAELQRFKKIIKKQQHRASNMGGIFIITSAVLCVIFFLSFL